MITALSRASMLALRAGWVAALCLLGASVGVEAQTQLAVRGVSVVDVVTGQTLPNQTILIEGDRIVAVGPSGGVEIPAGVETLDGTGLFAAPGLVDLHVHMEPDDLPLFLANGVTTVREMNGSAETLTLRAEVRSGVRPGPTIYTTGPLLAGVEQQWRHQLLSSVAAAESQVRTDHAAGYDFIKVYDGLDEPTYRALVETAAELDVPVLGHVPAAVGLDRVLEDGLLSIEHVEQLARATVGHDPDLTTIPETVAKLARGGRRSHRRSPRWRS